MNARKLSPAPTLGVCLSIVMLSSASALAQRDKDRPRQYSIVTRELFEKDTGDVICEQPWLDADGNIVRRPRDLEVWESAYEAAPDSDAVRRHLSAALVRFVYRTFERADGDHRVKVTVGLSLMERAHQLDPSNLGACRIHSILSHLSQLTEPQRPMRWRKNADHTQSGAASTTPCVCCEPKL